VISVAITVRVKLMRAAKMSKRRPSAERASSAESAKTRASLQAPPLRQIERIVPTSRTSSRAFSRDAAPPNGRGDRDISPVRAPARTGMAADRAQMSRSGAAARTLGHTWTPSSTSTLDGRIVPAGRRADRRTGSPRKRLEKTTVSSSDRRPLPRRGRINEAGDPAAERARRPRARPRRLGRESLLAGQRDASRRALPAGDRRGGQCGRARPVRAAAGEADRDPPSYRARVQRRMGEVSSGWMTAERFAAAGEPHRCATC